MLAWRGFRSLVQQQNITHKTPLDGLRLKGKPNVVTGTESSISRASHSQGWQLAWTRWFVSSKRQGMSLQQQAIQETKAEGSLSCEATVVYWLCKPTLLQWAIPRVQRSASTETTQKMTVIIFCAGCGVLTFNSSTQRQRKQMDLWVPDQPHLQSFRTVRATEKPVSKKQNKVTSTKNLLIFI